jgi:hypothetical protein
MPLTDETQDMFGARHKTCPLERVPNGKGLTPAF